MSAAERFLGSGFADGDHWPLLTVARRSRESNGEAHIELRERLAEVLAYADGRSLDDPADRMVVAELIALALETT